MTSAVSKINFFFLAFVILFFTYSYAAEHSHSANAEPGKTKLELDHGKKWMTDLPLRQGMEAIELLMNKNISAIHKKSLKDSDYKILGKDISTQTNNIFKNCKLSAEADQMLHRILAQILNAEQVFWRKNNTLSKHEAALDVMSALEDYKKYFDHKNEESHGRK